MNKRVPKHDTRFRVLQVHPVVLRLCAPLENTDAVRLASCLGLDCARFQRDAFDTSCKNLMDDGLNVFGSFLDSQEYFKVYPFFNVT